MIEENKTITMLPIDCLYPHPDNPRREVGDVTELADSLRANGIMQNLTVIPKTEDFRIPDAADWKAEYTVLIGHRRLAAAKKAGIFNLPCVIVEGIPRAQQIMIMNGENSQRHDLTPREEGESYQLMLDLGEDIDSIAEGVGLSRKTIKRRLELTRLDEKTEVKKSWQVNTEALELMSKIKDDNKLNEFYKKALSGSAFIWEMKNYLEKAAEQKIAEKICAVLKDKGFRRMSNESYKARRFSSIEIVRTLGIEESTMEELDTVTHHPEEMIVYDESEYGNSKIRIIRPKEEDEEAKAKKEEEERKREINRNKRMLADMGNEMQEAFESYVLYIVEHRLKPECKEETMIQRLWTIMINRGVYVSGEKVIQTVHGIEKMKDYTDDDILNIPMMYNMLILSKEDSWRRTVNNDGYFAEGNANMYKEKYEILQEFGFSMPNPEWLKLLDGSHEAFRKREETTNGI